MSSIVTATNTKWWIPQKVPAGSTLICRIGPLSLNVEHVAREWRLVASYEEETADATPPVAFELADDVLNSEKIERYVGPVDSDELRFKPVLPDRPVVIRPRQPMFLPSQTETVLYLSTPVWLQLEIADSEPIILKQVPTLELSDTWFGPSTRDGELCYSDKSRARSDLAEVPFRAHRVLTPVRVRNEAISVLPLEKLSLPVPILSVYGANDSTLHTQSISLVRGADSDMATLRIDERPSADVGSVEKLSEPRQSERRGLVRAFSILFGE